MTRGLLSLFCVCLLAGCVTGTDLVNGDPNSPSDSGRTAGGAEVPESLRSACSEWGASDADIAAMIKEMEQNKAAGMSATEQYTLVADAHCCTSAGNVSCTECMTSIVVYVFNEN